MINCPNCGTANRDESRFCSKCGTTLSSPAGRRCPMCGRMNPAANLFCDACGARLVPATPASTSAQEPKPAASSGPAADSTAVKKGLLLPAKPQEEPPAPPPPPVEASGESDDWLSRLRGNQPEPSAPDENVPDWLRGRGAESAEQVEQVSAFDLAARLGGSEPQPKPSAPVSEVPDWLAQLAPKTSASPTPATPATPEPGNVPDWLKSSASAAKAEAGESEIPDWLKEFALAPAATPSTPPEPAPAEIEMPREARPAQFEPPPPPSASAVAPSFEEADVPDWLKQPLPGESAQAPAPVSPPPPVFEPSTFAEPTSAETEIPDWLSQLATAPTAAPVQGTPLPVESETPREAWLQSLPPTTPSAPEPASTAFVGEAMPEPTEPVPAAPVQAELPDWLKELEAPPAVSEPEMTPEAPSPFKEPVAVPSAELPDWLKELKPAEAGAPAPPALTEIPAIAPAAGGLVAAQLPSWLKELQPTSAPAEPEKEEPAETEGMLEGVHGALPVAEIVSQALGTGVPRPLQPEIPANDLARAGALQELLAHGAAAVVRREGEGRAQRLWSNTQRWMVFLVIAVLAVLPLVQPNLVYGLVSAPPLDQVKDMFNNIQALPSGAAVLVAFDYDATQSPEMDTQARVLLRHLAARQANIKVASLYQAGPAAAQAVINQINSTLTGTLPIKVEQRGYLPGQDTAVAYFIQSTPISMVVELAATPDTVRWWVEQLAARSDKPTFLAGVSALAEPMSRPYVESAQVSGMMAGVPGAIAYQLKLRQVLQDDKDEMAQVLAPLASIGLVNIALVALMVLGGLIQLVSGRKPQPATRSGGRQRG